MVLTNQLFLGLVLLVYLTCVSSTSTTIPTRPRSRTTTTPPKLTVSSNHTTKSTTSSVHTTKSPPKITLQRTFASGTTSTETPDEKRKYEDKKRQDNGRSLAIISERYNIPDYHNENNVFSESKNYEKELSDKTVEYERIFDNIALTTPVSKLFDARHKQVQEEVVSSIDEKEKMISMRLTEEDRYYYSKAPEFSEPPEGEYKIDEFKRIESSESKNKNRIHKDYTVEAGKKMEMVRSYNVTKIIDEPKKNHDEKRSFGKRNDEKKGDEKKDDNPKDIAQNEVKNKLKKEKKPNDLDQEPSDQILEVHLEEIKQPKINAIDLNTHNNTSLNKEQLDPISVTNYKEIIVTKRGPKTRHKTTTPMVNLDESNIVEFTTKMNVDSTTESHSTTSSLKNKQTESKIESYAMKMINVINDNETATSEQVTTEKRINKEELTTTESETVPSDQGTNGVETTESLITTTEEEIITVNTEPIKEKKQVEETETTETVTKQTEAETKTEAAETKQTEAETKQTETETIQTETETLQTEIATNSSETKSDTTTPQNNIETTTAEAFDESGTNFGDLLEQILSNSTEVAPDTTTITTVRFYDMDDEDDTTFYPATTEKAPKTNDVKKNETFSNIANEIFKSHSSASPLTPSTENNEVRTVAMVENATKPNENEIIKQNEINVIGEKTSKVSTTEEPIEKDCFLEHCEEADEDYVDPNGNKKNQDLEEIEDNSERVVVNYDAKVTLKPSTTTTTEIESNNIEPRTLNSSTPKFAPVEVDLEVTTTPAGLVDDGDEGDDGNGGKIAAIVISTVGAVCLLLLVGLLIVMRKRQKRFNYGQRCRPVSLDAYSMDNVSIHNSTRRKGVLMTSKRSYGNAAFEDPNSPSHMLNFSELVKFANNTEEIHNEFEQIPQVQAKTSELPEGCDMKNRYANVIPLPETRVFLSSVEGDPTSDYINANYVTGAKSERRYYIACQAPLQTTISDFWRMIWEQEAKVILMLTHLYEHGVEKCSDYLPPSEVLDCHRLFGDFQVTLKKREVRDKYIISSLQLKNMVSNSWREVTHIWYIEWPHKGVPEEMNSLIRFLIEARSYMKMNEIKMRETNTSFIQGTNPRSPPVVVHCSPGTGRTGTVIACDIAIREFEQSRQVDIPKIVYKIRRDRASSVQNKEQYSFIYKVINLYATKLTGGAFDSF